MTLLCATQLHYQGIFKMAKNISTFTRKTRSKRPGVHCKKKSSKIKTSKNYNKKYRGQGR